MLSRMETHTGRLVAQASSSQGILAQAGSPCRLARHAGRLVAHRLMQAGCVILPDIDRVESCVTVVVRLGIPDGDGDGVLLPITDAVVVPELHCVDDAVSVPVDVLVQDAGTSCTQTHAGRFATHAGLPRRRRLEEASSPDRIVAQAGSSRRQARAPKIAAEAGSLRRKARRASRLDAQAQARAGKLE